MKKTIFTGLLLASSVSFFGQNKFPTTGNVGIGTSNPEKGKLHLNGTGPNQGINLWTNSGETSSRIWIDNQKKTFHLSRGDNPIKGLTINDIGLIGIGEINPEHGKLHINGTGAGQGINLWTNSGETTSRIWIDNQKKTFHLSRGDNPTKGMTINDIGSIGIGETNPEHGKLHINGTGASQGINLWTNSGESTSRIWIDNQKKTFHLSRGDKPAQGITINNIGSVGIGTTNPDSKLTVKGKVHCQEVLVNLEVPADYVFEKYYTGASNLKENYTMPTLQEVEAYTKENHHLPNVPSAKTIQEEGLQLKEMTNLLLQKIEELTLYTIEQEKRIKRLEAQQNSSNK